MGTVPRIASRDKLDDKSHKTKNMLAKKSSTAELASSSIAKRPNTKGGFVVDSESDIEESGQSDQDDDGSQSGSTVRHLSRASESPSFVQASLGNEFSATPLPTKQLNKSRLGKLLERARAVSTTPKQEKLHFRTQRSATTTAAISIALRPTTALGLKESAFLHSTGSGNADRAQCSTAACTMENMESFNQQAKVIDSSVSKTDRNVSSISQRIQRPTVAVTDHGRVPTQANPSLTPPTTAAAGSSSTPLLQQRKPVLGAGMNPKHKNDTPSKKTSLATKPISLLQSTLSAARRDTTGNTPRTQPQASGRGEQSVTKSLTLTSSARKSESIPPCAKEYETTASNAASKQHSSSAIQNPKASSLEASQRAHHHTQVSDARPGKPTPAVSKADVASSKSTPSIPGQPAQKRKLNNISGGSGHVTVTAPKRPAISLETPLKGPGNTRVESKADTTPRSVSSTGEVSRKIPVKSYQPPASVTMTWNSGLNSTSAITISEQNSAGVLHSPTISTLVGHRKSSVATSNDLYSTPAVSQLPENARKAAISKPIKNCMTPMETLPAQVKSVDQSLRFVSIPTKFTSGKSPEFIEHASVVHHAAKRAPSNELQATGLAESTVLETCLPVSTDNIEKAVLRSDESRNEDARADLDSNGTTTVPIQRHDAIADVPPAPTAAVDHGPSYQPETPASLQHMVKNAHEIVLTPLISPLISDPPSSAVEEDSSEDILHLSCSLEVSKEAQPYFEYSVFQKIWSSKQVEEDIPATESTVRPFTNLEEANAQAEKTFQGSSAHLIDAIFKSSYKRDEHECSIFTSTAAPLDNPQKKLHSRIWVQRDIVSRFANQTPQTLKGTSFISSTCYILRLFNLAEQADTKGSEGSDSDSDDSDASTREPVRVYHPHTRPEVYITLDAANRAARALQIELSHEKEPKDAFSKAFQEKNLRELDAKVVELRSAEMHGGDGCWKSRFNASGRGGDSLEVVVEKTGICGPRNL